MEFKGVDAANALPQNSLEARFKATKKTATREIVSRRSKMNNLLTTVGIATIVQIVVALSIYNVWLLRSGRATNWRGGEAKNMREEFAIYGLPGWFMGMVGFLKLTFATLLLAGVWFPALTTPAAIGMVVLMAGAVSMHVKVRDPALKSLPAFTMLAMSAFVAVV